MNDGRHPPVQVRMALAEFLQDLRYTIRVLRRDAGFAAFAVLIAGVGIGASVTVFSVVHTLVLRPLPFAEPDRLVWIANSDTAGLSGQTTPVGHMLDLRERTRSLSAVRGFLAFYGVGDNLLSGKGEPERLSGVPYRTTSSTSSVSAPRSAARSPQRSVPGTVRRRYYWRTGSGNVASTPMPPSSARR